LSHQPDIIDERFEPNTVCGISHNTSTHTAQRMLNISYRIIW